MGKTIMNRTMFAVLSVLNRHGEALPSGEIAERLTRHGIDLSERTVRFYLKILEEKGFTEKEGVKKGRRITKEGREELNRTFASERISFVIGRIDNLSVLTDFSIETGEGQVILNVSYVPEERLEEALQILNIVLFSPYSTSTRIIIGRAGEQIGHTTVPQGMVAIGTVCSITLNGLFLQAGIPVDSRFGGVVEVIDGEPSRFASIVSYEGSSVPPLEVFIRSRMTNVLGALNQGKGNVLGSFREIPRGNLSDARRLARKMRTIGFGGRILFGQPGKPLLGVPVNPDRIGMVVLGGLNPVAALEEAGIAAESRAMATLCDYSLLSSVDVMEMLHFPKPKSERSLLTDHLPPSTGTTGISYWSVFEGMKQTTL